MIIPARLLCQIIQANYSGAEFLQPYPRSWREWILSLLQFTSFTKREIRHVHGLRRTVDGKEMYKKAWCSCKVVVLPCQAIAYLTFLSPPHLKLPIILRYILIRQKQNILGANSIAPAHSIPNVFFDSSVVPSFLDRKVEKKVSLARTSLVNELGMCGETIAVVYELMKRTQAKLFADWAQ